MYNVESITNLNLSAEIYTILGPEYDQLGITVDQISTALSEQTITDIRISMNALTQTLCFQNPFHGNDYCLNDLIQANVNSSLIPTVNETNTNSLVNIPCHPCVSGSIDSLSEYTISNSFLQDMMGSIINNLQNSITQCPRNSLIPITSSNGNSVPDRNLLTGYGLQAAIGGVVALAVIGAAVDLIIRRRREAAAAKGNGDFNSFIDDA